MNCTLAAECRIGARRVNQDRVAHWRTPRALLMVVADGLGGHAHGELAAELAVQSFGAAFAREAQPALGDPAAFLGAGMAAAHAAILDQARRRRLAEAPRTVLVACVVQDGHAWWTHVGDCRLYLVREGRIVARTRDHSFVQQLVDAGRLAEDAAAEHPARNLLVQCLGGEHAPRPDAPRRARLAPNDVLLLCSDGLWGPLAAGQIARALRPKGLARAIRELAAAAERRAGRQCDNVSALAMAWGEDQAAAQNLE